MPTTTSTPTPGIASDLDAELKLQYQGLTDDLKKYFDSRLNTFLTKEKSSYPNSANYYKDRGDFLINQKIDDLDTHRSNVWNYLTTEFNQNTKDKYLNALALSQNKRDVIRQEKNFEDLSKKYEENNTKSNVGKRQREILQYEYNRRNDLLFIMQVIFGTLVICVFITALVNFTIMPYEVIYAVLVIFILLILYIIYYIYFNKPGRSKRYWDKIDFASPDQPTFKSSARKNGDKPKGNLDKLNTKLDTEFNKYLDASCKRAKPTPGPTVATSTSTPSSTSAPART
jgi:hypothetical protein